MDKTAGKLFVRIKSKCSVMYIYKYVYCKALKDCDRMSH